MTKSFNDSLPFSLFLDKYFKNEYNINNKTELKNMINNFNLRYSDLKWSELMSLY